MNITLEYKGGIQGQNRGKILRLLLHAIRSHLHQRILLPPMVFLDLRILQQQLKVDQGLALCYISLCLPLIEALVFLFLHLIFLCRNLLLIETTIRNASKEGNPDRKPHRPFGFMNPYRRNNQ